MWALLLCLQVNCSIVSPEGRAEGGTEGRRDPNRGGTVALGDTLWAGGCALKEQQEGSIMD